MKNYGILAVYKLIWEIGLTGGKLARPGGLRKRFPKNSLILT